MMPLVSTEKITTVLQDPHTFYHEYKSLLLGTLDKRLLILLNGTINLDNYLAYLKLP